MDFQYGFYGGRRRKLYTKTCIRCGESYLVPMHFFEKRQFCSPGCAAESKKNRREYQCEQCGQVFSRAISKELNSRHQKFFCSRACKDKAQSLQGKVIEIRPTHYGNGHSSYRQRALRSAARLVCGRCGYDEVPEILEVHHRDRDRFNGSPENLELLCPNCHAIEHRVSGLSLAA